MDLRCVPAHYCEIFVLECQVHLQFHPSHLFVKTFCVRITKIANIIFHKDAFTRILNFVNNAL